MNTSSVDFFNYIGDMVSDIANKPAAMTDQVWRDLSQHFLGIKEDQLLHSKVTEVIKTGNKTKVVLSCVMRTEDSKIKRAYSTIVAVCLESTLRRQGFIVVDQQYNKHRKKSIEVIIDQDSQNEIEPINTIEAI